MGILYIASYLRRGGIEAYVRLYDRDVTDKEIARSLEALVARVRPRVVGISLKWFHHLHRALVIAKAVRKIDPTIRIVLGGNSASHWWRELAAFDCIDHIVLGDGEKPMLAICQGDPAPPNCITRAPDGSPRRLPLAYVQSAENSEDVYYSHFDDIFLSHQDRHSFSGWIAPGKGCKENCLYCAGARKNQRENFGRLNPFTRAERLVLRDHEEVAPRAWQIRYDFPGSTAEYMERSWGGVDLSRHACTYFLWGLPHIDLVAALSRRFEKVWVAVDIGCFSEQQRFDTMRRGLLKPCPSDAELLSFIERSRPYANVELEISGIAGLPFASTATLREEARFVEKIIGMDCVAGYQRLEAQPGALATDEPERFDMVTEARTFAEFLAYFEQREPGDQSVPMLRFKDKALERAVQSAAEQTWKLAFKHRTERRKVAINGRTPLKNAAHSTQRFALGEWFGSHVVPAKVAQEGVTVVRSEFGASLVCAPSVGPRAFSDPSLTQGDDARLLLAALSTYEQPKTVAQGTSQLASKVKLDAGTARAAIDELVEARFLRPA